MIVRTWSGRVKPGSATAYLAFLRDHVFPEIRAVPGNISARAFQGAFGDDDLFVVQTEWADLESVKAFAGPDPDVAVVPAEARELLASYDDEVEYFNVALEDRNP